MTMEQERLLNLIAEWEADPDGVVSSDNLCDVADALDLPSGEYTAEELRDAIDRRAGGRASR